MKSKLNVHTIAISKPVGMQNKLCSICPRIDLCPVIIRISFSSDICKGDPLPWPNGWWCGCDCIVCDEKSK